MYKLVEKYKSILNLQNWDFTVIEEPTLDTDACCKMIYNDYKAIIKVKSEMSGEQKERSLIHELLHCLHRDELDVAQECIDDEYQREIYTRFHERSIEQMAKIIYKLVNHGKRN